MSLEHKTELFYRYREEIGDEELIKRLGLQEWEYRYITQTGEYKRGDELDDFWNSQKKRRL